MELPLGFEKFEKILTNVHTNQILRWIGNKVSYPGLGSVDMASPDLVFIFKYNKMDKRYNQFATAMEANTTKWNWRTVLVHCINHNIDLETIKEIWETQRAVQTDVGLLETLTTSDKKYSDYFLSTKKFFNGLKKLSITDINKLDNIFNEPIFLEYEKFKKWVVETYSNTGKLHKMLPEEISDIFLF